MAKIKVIIKRPDEEYGHMTHISASLKNLQNIVGGYIEVVEVDDLTVICNEEGKIIGLEENIKCYDDVFVGTIVICGEENENFADIPVSFEDWKKIADSWRN